MTRPATIPLESLRFQAPRMCQCHDEARQYFEQCSRSVPLGVFPNEQHCWNLCRHNGTADDARQELGGSVSDHTRGPVQPVHESALSMPDPVLIAVSLQAMTQKPNEYPSNTRRRACITFETAPSPPRAGQNSDDINFTPMEAERALRAKTPCSLLDIYRLRLPCAREQACHAAICTLRYLLLCDARYSPQSPPGYGSASTGRKGLRYNSPAVLGMKVCSVSLSSAHDTPTVTFSPGAVDQKAGT